MLRGWRDEAWPVKASFHEEPELVIASRSSQGAVNRPLRWPDLYYICILNNLLTRYVYISYIILYLHGRILEIAKWHVFGPHRA